MLVAIIVAIVCIIIALVNAKYLDLYNETKEDYEIRCTELARKCKELDDKLQRRDNLIKHQTQKLAEQDKCLNDILAMCDNKEYLNLQVRLGKIKELAKTGINR